MLEAADAVVHVAVRGRVAVIHARQLLLRVLLLWLLLWLLLLVEGRQLLLLQDAG